MKKKDVLLQTFFYDFLKIQVTKWIQEVSSPQALIAHSETATAHANDSSSSKVDQRKFTSQKYPLY
jgi:hypothetical protein